MWEDLFPHPSSLSWRHRGSFILLLLFPHLSRKYPKNLIGIHHASPAPCIQSHDLAIQVACLHVCMCEVEWDRQRHAGRITLCSLWISKVIYKHSGADLRKAPIPRLNMWFQGFEDLFKVRDRKGTSDWPDVCFLLLMSKTLHLPSHR